MIFDYIRSGEHDFGAFFPEFSSPGSSIGGSEGQISKLILTPQNLYPIVQLDELSWLVRTFLESDFSISSYD